MLTEEIKLKLEQSLPGSKVEVINNTLDHVGHNSSKDHIIVKVLYAGFKDKTLLEQHQMIIDLLQDEMREKIHALQIKTAVPDPLFEKFQDLIHSAKIFLFMKGNPQAPKCGFSARVVKLLGSHEFKSFDILEDEEMREAIKRFSNWPTFPQLYVHGKLVGGCDIITELAEKGELEKILN